MKADGRAYALDGRIAPRSGLAVKNFIDTGAGVIDADYRGQVKVLLFNHSDTDLQGTEYRARGYPPWASQANKRNYTVKEGDRIAQLVLERVCASPEPFEHCT